MHETVLRDFFTGSISVATLVDDLQDAIVSGGSSVVRHPIVDMPDAFDVRSSHLVAICDVFLDDKLKSDDLRAIGFCLIASESFEWDAETPDGERVADVTNHWSSPEINFPINSENVNKWRAYLETGNNTLH